MIQQVQFPTWQSLTIPDELEPRTTPTRRTIELRFKDERTRRRLEMYLDAYITPKRFRASLFVEPMMHGDEIPIDLSELGELAVLRIPRRGTVWRCTNSVSIDGFEIPDGLELFERMMQAAANVAKAVKAGAA